MAQGTTVQTFPGSDLWALGARFGTAVATRKGKVLVRFQGRAGTRWICMTAVIEA